MKTTLFILLFYSCTNNNVNKIEYYEVDKTYCIAGHEYFLHLSFTPLFENGLAKKCKH